MRRAGPLVAGWLGVRSPLVDGGAPLLRMRGSPASALAVEAVHPLDLGGFGVRDLVATPDALWVLAGPTDGRAAPHRLYRLDAVGSAPVQVRDDLPAGAEGMVFVGDDLVVVVDGDGKPGERCAAPATWRRMPRGRAPP